LGDIPFIHPSLSGTPSQANNSLSLSEDYEMDLDVARERYCGLTIGLLLFSTFCDIFVASWMASYSLADSLRALLLLYSEALFFKKLPS
jgi:hypothetical protein